MSVLFPLQLMLVNPKKLDRLEIDKENAQLKAINGAQNTTFPNIVMILFKHLTEKKDIINLFHNLTQPEYSSTFANLVVDKMAEKIKQFFVTYAANNTVLKWNKPGEGLFALVLDPTYQKSDNQRFAPFVSLMVGGFGPNRGVTFNFKGRQIRWTEIMADSWKLQWYQSAVNQTSNANAIDVRKLATTIKFTLGEFTNRYPYTQITPPAPTATTPVTPPPANPSPTQPSQPAAPESPKPASS